MRVLIFEPQFKGHNLVYAARLMRAVLELGCEPVVATSRQAAESPEFELHFGQSQTGTGCRRFRLHAMDGFRTDKGGRRLKTNGVKGSVEVYTALKSAVDAVKPGHVYVPYGNFLARTALLPFGLRSSLRRAGAEAETLLISGRYLESQTKPLGKLRQWVLLEAIARGPWSRVFHLVDAAVDEFKKHGARMAEIGALLPDPTSESPEVGKEEARRRFNLPTGGRAVVVAGLIEKRKGVHLLIDALRGAGDRLRPDDRLLLIGPQHPEVRAMLAGAYADLVHAGRVVCVDRRLSSEEVGCAIRAADVLANLYLNHPYTSSILIAGAQARRPVLGVDSGWIGRTIERFELGHTCDAGSVEEVSRALVTALDTSGRYRPTPAAERFVEFSSDANFAAHWTARLRERLGVGPSPHLRTWDWVLSGGELPQRHAA